MANIKQQEQYKVPISNLPHDYEAERVVLAGMLNSPTILDDVFAELIDDDFSNFSYRTIFAAMRVLYQKGSPIDLITLADYLRSIKQLENIGGPKTLAQISEDRFSLATWQSHAKILHRDSTLRNMICACDQIATLAQDNPEDTKGLIETSEELLLKATNRDIRSAAVPVSDPLSNLYTKMSDMFQNGRHIIGIKTGYPSFDQAFLGLRPGQMVVVGARPGVGKTSFALNLAQRMAKQGSSVIFFSLEMSQEEIAERLVSAASGIDLQKIRSADIPQQGWSDLLAATERLSRLDIMIDDTPGTTVTEIRAKARRLLRKKENGVIIIDYIQLISSNPDKRYDNRATEVGEMSRNIKIMAKDLGVPVIALSQLSRKNENRVGKGAKRPQLSDLRESGSIEQDADIVVLLDRSSTQEEGAREDRPDFGITQFIIAKNRSGPQDIIDMKFDAQRTVFTEIDKYHEG